MTEDRNLIKEAEGWLNETIRELEEDPYYKYDRSGGWDLQNRIEHEIRKYAPELQQAVRTVLGQWLLGSDGQRVHMAMDLILRLKAVEHIATLQELRRRISCGRAPLGKEWVLAVDNVLAKLSEDGPKR